MLRTSWTKSRSSPSVWSWTPDKVQATVPMLRGVWGNALYHLDRQVYHQVFAPLRSDVVPGYLLRPAPFHFQLRMPAVDWFLIGGAIEHESVLRRAWDIASGGGLGPKRIPFTVRRLYSLRFDDEPEPAIVSWPLALAPWPLPVDAPCRLRFDAPLRLVRHEKLVPQPMLADLAVAAGRRVRAFLPARRRDDWDGLCRGFLEEARARPSLWTGAGCDLQRYSGQQRAEIELRGVAGVLDLPEGPGPLWPLLAAARWLHLGKGTVFGLGQLEVEKMEAAVRTESVGA